MDGLMDVMRQESAGMDGRMDGRMDEGWMKDGTRGLDRITGWGGLIVWDRMFR
ncbi:hypothetical protein DPMN_006560 [Dreissena polymorpha]|uniref:Uncharacterized protein n=1 Tax=Dreissena polymorpha TaxID=45954 RepID=A0A9D4MS52_DREPO|nr:hypothetical protein DPMN_006560 [Dreissena polymorpha]